MIDPQDVKLQIVDQEATKEFIVLSAESPESRKQLDHLLQRYKGVGLLETSPGYKIYIRLGDPK